MSDLTVNAGDTVTINLPLKYPDQGWTVEGGIATHEPCNAGYITSAGLTFEVGKMYTITYEVTN